MDSLLLITGRKSTLEAQFFPPIALDPAKRYVLGLINLETYNTIPNVIKGFNDSFHYYEHDQTQHSIVLPQGSYELDDIVEYLVRELSKRGVTLKIELNRNTVAVALNCNRDIDFSRPDSIGKIFGFSTVLTSNETHVSSSEVQISSINLISVSCNLVSGSFRNGIESHVIYSFFPRVPPGYKIIETPQTVVYLPLNTSRTVSHISLELVDQTGRTVNFMNEEISVQLHLKATD